MKNSVSRLGIFYAITLSTAFYQTKALTDQYLMPKHYLFMFAGLISVMAILVYYISKKYQLRYRIKALDVSIVALTMYTLLHIFFSGNNIIDYSAFLTLALLTVIYLLFLPLFLGNTDNPDRSSFKITVMWVIIIAGGLQALLGFGQYYGILEQSTDEFNITGTFGNPGPYSCLLVTMMPFAIACAFALNKGLAKALAIAVSVLIIAVLPYTEARTSWIAALAVIAYILLHHKLVLDWIKKLYKSTLAIIIMVVLLVGLLAGGFYALTSFKQDSASGRLFVWEVTLEMIKDKPVFGHGYERYPAVHNDYQAEYFKQNPDDWDNAYLADSINYAFNEYLQLAAETGIVGLLIFLSILFFAFKSAKWEKINRINYISIGARASLIAVAVCSMFSYPLQNVPVLVIMFFSLSVLSGNSVQVVKELTLKPGTRKFLIIAGVLLCILTFRLVKKRFDAEKEWLETFKLVRVNQFQKAQDNYTRLHPVLKFNRFFLYNYGAELTVMKEYQKSIEILKSVESRLNDADFYIYLATNYMNTGNTKEAIRCFEQATYLMPVKFYPRYQLAMIYDAMGNKDKALAIAKEILAMPVKVDSEIVSNIKLEMQNYIESASEQ